MSAAQVDTSHMSQIGENVLLNVLFVIASLSKFVSLHRGQFSAHFSVLFSTKKASMEEAVVGIHLLKTPPNLGIPLAVLLTYGLLTTPLKG